MSAMRRRSSYRLAASMEYPAPMNLFLKMFVSGHVALFRSTNGGMGSSMGGNQLLLLTTKGAKSGKPADGAGDVLRGRRSTIRGRIGRRKPQAPCVVQESR